MSAASATVTRRRGESAGRTRACEQRLGKPDRFDRPVFTLDV